VSGSSIGPFDRLNKNFYNNPQREFPTFISALKASENH
jgi:hypothetical protein